MALLSTSFINDHQDREGKVLSLNQGPAMVNLYAETLDVCSQTGPTCMCCFHNIAFTVSPGLLVKQYKRPVLVAFSSQNFLSRLFCFMCIAISCDENLDFP